ncbi:hypothetical protein ACVYBL_14225 [Acinetobacter baumannii]|jgi:hypothetical protein|uniref:hypothetical protein n=2 Tax=Moraxellaceae TaxID=468 RepID=UPI001D17BC4A|nr:MULTISPECIES: hypothetical protein [Acinetobacter]MCF1274405.1 hypothetical protein [Acinetobacter nosocomialis]MCG9292097.1 hypothetical protein [Acinetobacter nosocomialis]MDV5589030.1 hypothetical protein [Acinetobacter nosocomialis]USI40840.1 hypothetical protein NE421_19780 [Acinetobacter baumannii]USI44702.1 hypothetical protein NE424_19405 [Acinetobacter baumannii]
MLKFDYLIKNIEIFMGLFIMPFCFDRPDIQIEMVKINSELLKIKKIKQSQKVVVQAKFKVIYVKIWQKILLLMQTERGLRVHSNYVAIIQLIQNLDYFIEKSQQHSCFERKAQKELDAKFFARFFKLTKNSIKDQLIPNCADLNEFYTYNSIKI